MSGFQSIPDFVGMTISGGSSDLHSPLEVSEMLHNHADRAISLLGDMNAGDNTELGYILHDIRTMAYLGKYYAHKIAGSLNVALYRETDDNKYQSVAVKELEDALEYWTLYTRTAMEQNVNPIWTNRVGYVDWIKITEWVKQDIEIAKNQNITN
jgi:hypothetical protein